MKSLFLQETVKKGILFSGIQNISFSHSDQDIAKALSAIKTAFEVMKKALAEDNSLSCLEGKPVKPILENYAHTFHEI